MRIIPHPRGRCHVSNYWTVVQILSPDVDCSHAVSVVLPRACFVCAVEYPSLWLALALMFTHGTRATGMVFVLQRYHHAKPLSFVGELVSNSTSRPLMDLLVGLSTNIVVLSDIAHIAYDHGLHALLIQRANKSCCLFVFNISDLVLEFPQLFLFRLDQFLSSTGAFLAPTDSLVQVLGELVTILPFGSEESPVHNMGMLSIVRDCHVDLAQIDSSNFTAHGLCFCFFKRVGCNGFVLSPCPVDDHGSRQFPAPIEYKRCIAPSIRKHEFAVFETNCTHLVFDFEVPTPSVWRMSMWVSFATCMPRFHTCHEGLNTGIGCVSMQLGTDEQPFEMLLFEPLSLVSDSPPEEDHSLRVEFPTSMSQLIEPGRLADVDPSRLIHSLPLLLPFLQGNGQGLHRHQVRISHEENASYVCLHLQSGYLYVSSCIYYIANMHTYQGARTNITEKPAYLLGSNPVACSGFFHINIAFGAGLSHCSHTLFFKVPAKGHRCKTEVALDGVQIGCVIK
jgi:hypothetical protein